VTSAGNQPSRLDVMLYDAGLHNRSRNRARNWVHSRIWPSRDYFLSTPSTRKTTIIPLLSLVCRTARPAAAPHGPNDCGDLPPLAVLKYFADGVATSRAVHHPPISHQYRRERVNAAALPVAACVDPILGSLHPDCYGACCSAPAPGAYPRTPEKSQVHSQTHSAQICSLQK
jgi:hypothetical protein